MKIAVVGINHNNTPIEIREKFSFTDTMKIESGNTLLDGSIKEVIIMSTCNRSEIYIASENIGESIEEVKSFYREYFEFSNVEKYLFEKEGRDAVVHLYMVSAGLDSMVLGEDQILGQIKQAIEFSMDLGFSKKVLNRLFMDAIAEGKKIRSQLKMSEIPLSTSYIGISLLKEKMRSLNGKKALIIGAGEMGTLAVRYLYEEGLDKIYLSNRNHNRVNDMFKEFEDIIPIKYKERYEILKDVDILITATGAHHTVVKKEDLIEDPKKQLYILDLALPRDVDENLRDMENVLLYDNDDLQKLSDENLKRREELSLEAIEIINWDVEKYMHWMGTIKIDPVIESLNERCISIKDNTMHYLNRKINFDKRDEKIVEKMILSALKQFTREPIEHLKNLESKDSDEYISAMKKIFEI